MQPDKVPGRLGGVGRAVRVGEFQQRRGDPHRKDEDQGDEHGRGRQFDTGQVGDGGHPLDNLVRLVRERDAAVLAHAPKVVGQRRHPQQGENGDVEGVKVAQRALPHLGARQRQVAQLLPDQG